MRRIETHKHKREADEHPQYSIKKDNSLLFDTPWYDRFIIKRSNPFMSFYYVIIAILTILSIFANLHISCFESTGGDLTWQVVQECIFGFDIILTFFTEIEKDDGYNTYYVRSPKLIALEYLGGYFIIDFIAFFPFFEVLSRHNTISSQKD